MTQLSKAQLLTDIADFIFTNEDEDITGDILAQRLKNIVDSFYNITDTTGEFIQQGSNTLTEELSFSGNDINMNGYAIKDVVIEDSSGNTIFNTRSVFESAGNQVADFQNEYLGGTKRSVSWGNYMLQIGDIDNSTTLDWLNRIAYGKGLAGWTIYWRGDGTGVGDVRERWDEPTTSIITETFNGTSWDFRSSR